MSYEQYWEGEAWLLETYASVYKQKRDMELSMLDLQCWCTGIYVHYAMSDVMASSFSKTKTSSKFPKKPCVIEKPLTKEEREEKAIMDSYNNFIAAVHSNGMRIQ